MGVGACTAISKFSLLGQGSPARNPHALLADLHTTAACESCYSMTVSLTWSNTREKTPTLGFFSCCVLEGRAVYAASPLHS